MPLRRPTPDEDPRAVRAVRQSLVRSAIAQGIPAMDADEVADRALEKAMLRSSMSGIPLALRGRQALKDERAEYFRRCDARPLIATSELPDVSSQDDPSSAIELLDSCHEIARVYGEDILKYAFLRIAGFSEREIAQQEGWDALRAGRVRRRLERNAPAIYDRILNMPSMPNEQEKAS